jgi:Domain of unknown function (DUF4157)/HNH/ENDO VII superfamily nuclease with conserved GHE residues
VNTTEQATAKPSSQPSAPVHANLLQLKCACGGTAGVDGKCGECREKQLQENVFGEINQDRAPHSAREAIHAPGEPPDPESRALSKARLGHDFSRIRVNSPAPMSVQPKLRMSAPNDRYEQEANRVAAQVIPTPAPPLQRQPELDRDEAQLQTETLARRIAPFVQWDGMLRPHGSASSSLVSFEGRLNSGKGGGSPLPPSVRREMEPRFGADFGGVRIHTDDAAARMSQELNAHAFTHGSDIYFNSGRFDARSRAGRMLLAHELTHTIQQGAAARAAAPIPALQQQALRLQGQAYALQVGIAGIGVGQAPVGIQRLDLGFLPDVGGFVSSVGESLLEGAEFVGESLLEGAEFVGESLLDMADLLGEAIPDDPIEAIETILAALEHPWVRPIVSAIPSFIAVKVALRQALQVLKLIQYVIDNQDQIIEEIKSRIEACLDGVTTLVEARLREALKLVGGEHFEVIWQGYVQPMLVHLKDDWWETVKTGLWEQIWPFEGITSLTAVDPEKRTGMGRELGAILDALSRGFDNLLDANFSQALDDFLVIGKNLVALANRFAGWASLITIAIPTILGAAAGGPVGAVAGFGAGVTTAGTLGLGLLYANLGVEAAVLLKSVLSLKDFENRAGGLTNEEKFPTNHIYYQRIAESGLALGLMGALIPLSWVGGKIAQGLVNKLLQYLPKNAQQVLQKIATTMERGARGERPSDVAKSAGKAPPETAPRSIGEGPPGTRAPSEEAPPPPRAPSEEAPPPPRAPSEEAPPPPVREEAPPPPRAPSEEAPPPPRAPSEEVKAPSETAPPSAGKARKPRKTKPDREDPQKGVKEALDRARREIAEASAQYEAADHQRWEATKKVRSLEKQRDATPQNDPNRTKISEELGKAIQELKEAEKATREYVEARIAHRQRETRLSEALDAKTYARPGTSGKFWKAVREKVWQSALKESKVKGKVLSPSGKEIKPGDPWVLGHKEKWEFWKHQRSAAERGISREQFLKEFQDYRQFRPETPEDNLSHKYESKTDEYLGPPSP